MFRTYIAIWLSVFNETAQLYRPYVLWEADWILLQPIPFLQSHKINPESTLHETNPLSVTVVVGLGISQSTQDSSIYVSKLSLPVSTVLGFLTISGYLFTMNTSL